MTYTGGDAGAAASLAVGINDDASAAADAGFIHAKINVSALAKGVIGHGHDKIGIAVEGAAGRTRLLGAELIQPDDELRRCQVAHA